MADHTQFKHIKVNAACDDVVIYAGTHNQERAAKNAVDKPAAEELEASSAEEPAASAPEEPAASAPEASGAASATEEPEVRAPEAHVAAKPAPEGHVATNPASEAASRREADKSASYSYSPTTLQDLRTSKMPTMQKAIIAIAVVAVAAFVIWYLFFH